MSGNVYQSRDLVSVLPFTNAPILYGFKTNSDGATRTQLGHRAVPGAYPANLVIGANLPKPPRASIIRGVTSTRTRSTFCSADKVTEARAAGWTVRPGKVRRGYSTAAAKCVYVTDGTVKYAWMMPTRLYNRIQADLAGLGIELADGNDRDLVFGASYPVLPRAAFRAIAADGAVDVLGTFVDPQRVDNLPTGWTLARSTDDAF